MRKTNSSQRVGSVLNVARAALDARRLPIVIKQLSRYLFEKKGRRSAESNRAWLAANCTSIDDYARQLDSQLWEEAAAFSRRLGAAAEAVREQSGFTPYGGAADALLYFLTRYLQPSVIVETGVAAGYSSCAFLTAIQQNGRGRLFSSDFPNLRLPEPEKHIGVLVDDHLRKDWTLLLEGDAINLPIIARKAGRIDLFHYDSDKSYAGREFALSLIRPRMNPGGVILIDDIEDNSHFHDYVTTRRVPHWRVCRSWDKYLGMIGEPSRGSGWRRERG